MGEQPGPPLLGSPHSSAWAQKQAVAAWRQQAQAAVLSAGLDGQPTLLLLAAEDLSGNLHLQRLVLRELALLMSGQEVPLSILPARMEELVLEQVRPAAKAEGRRSIRSAARLLQFFLDRNRYLLLPVLKLDSEFGVWGLETNKDEYGRYLKAQMKRDKNKLKTRSN